MKSACIRRSQAEAESIDKLRNVKDPEMAAEKQSQTSRSLEMAETHFKDASYEGLSTRARADAAADACYAYALALAGPLTAGHLHPDPDVLRLAAETLGWPRSDMEPAVQRLREREDLLRDGSGFETLMALARRMREAV